MSADPVKSVAHRFFGFCALIMLGAVAIWITLEILARVWGWILLVLAFGVAGYLAFVLIRRRQSKW